MSNGSRNPHSLEGRAPQASPIAHRYPDCRHGQHSDAQNCFASPLAGDQPRGGSGAGEVHDGSREEPKGARSWTL